MPRTNIVIATFAFLLALSNSGTAQTCSHCPPGCACHRPDFCADDMVCDDLCCDDIVCDALCCDGCGSGVAGGELSSFEVAILRDERLRVPAMLGGFFGGNRIAFRGDLMLDRLVAVADDLDVPGLLPGGGNTLTINEPGPVGIFSSSVGSIQQLQSLYRAGSPIPAFNLEGSIADSATLTTLSTISDIQAQLAGTGVGFDIILLAAPPGTYFAAVDGVFQNRNGGSGVTVLNNGSSGALLQGGVDTLVGGEDLDAFYFYDYIIRLNTSLVDVSSGGVGRMKIAENGVVLPQDRVFFRFGSIFNTTYAASSPNLTRCVTGFERAIGNGLMSIELRAPFATNVVNDYSVAGNTITNGATTRFGNLSLYLKGLLVDHGSFAVSGGLGVSLPTASDTSVHSANGTELLHISSEAFHLQPFIGMLYTQSSKWFAQAFFQYDIAGNGNSVAFDTGTGLTSVGTLTDTNQLLLDGQIGYWLYQSNQSRGLSGIIPMLELHQTVATGDGDIVSAGPLQVGNFDGNRCITNLVAGTTFEFGTRLQITAGYTAAVGSDRDYDGAFQVQFNQLLGGW